MSTDIHQRRVPVISGSGITWRDYLPVVHVPGVGAVRGKRALSRREAQQETRRLAAEARGGRNA